MLKRNSILTQIEVSIVITVPRLGNRLTGGIEHFRWTAHHRMDGSKRILSENHCHWAQGDRIELVLEVEFSFDSSIVMNVPVS